MTAATIYSEAAEAKPAVYRFGGADFSATIIDTSQPEGRAALACWSHIPDEERAKWAKPADTRTLEQVIADQNAAFGWVAK